jgi:predicted acylesterase/phospholipase RssA
MVRLMPGEAAWWRGLDCDLNGTFQGGGAKGLLYAGALQACFAKGHWFRAVAGASAGAITATLIAAGVHPDRLGTLAVDGLGKIRRNFLMDLVGQPFINTRALEQWLESLLQAQVAAVTTDGVRVATGNVTFEELFAATGIELFVVCVDVADRQPLVFHRRTAATLSVSKAVVASSSIPFAFRPSRLRVVKGGTTEVHRLMDGGVWANYPDFVFRDPSFGAFHGTDLNSPTVIGFALEQRATAATRPEQFEEWGFGQHADKGAGLKGWMRNPLIRVYLLTIVPIVLTAEVMWTLSHYGLLVIEDHVASGAIPSWLVGPAEWFNGFFTRFTPFLWLSMAAVFAFAVAMLLLGATLIDSGLSALRTLMAVGTDVPYWSGSHPDDHLIRLTVPDDLKTMTFKLPAHRIETIVEDARNEAADQLAQILS